MGRHIYYIGDSTVQFNSYATYPQTGMSQALSLFTQPDVTVHCHGKNGRSTKSFLEEGLFAPVEAALGEGDLLLIQFGHNDNKPDEARFTQPFGSFRKNLLHYIRAARAKGAYPVLVTPIARRLFDSEGVFLPGSHGFYPGSMTMTGQDENVPVAMLTQLTERYLAQLGDLYSRPLFMWPVDNTHLKYEGAVKMVSFLCEQLQQLGAPYSDLLYPADAEEKIINDEVF